MAAPHERSQVELAEERDRAAAAEDDAALVRYLAKWTNKIRKLQRAHPARWHVPGLSDDEVRDALTLRLIEAVRTGEAWSLSVMNEQLRALRRRFGLATVSAEVEDAPLLERPASQEQRWLEGEAVELRARARARAELGLSRPQRRWLAALELSANAGGLFEASDAPNLAAASRVLGKNRSSAQRAYRELQARFAAELERLGSE